MATTVYDAQVITLQDDDETEITVKPLVLAQLRKFYDEYERINKDAQARRENDEPPLSDSDVFSRLGAVCLERNLKNRFPLTKVGRRDLLAFIEESCDIPTLNEIIKVSSGMDLSEPIDPKLLEALMAVEESQSEEEDGVA